MTVPAAPVAERVASPTPVRAVGTTVSSAIEALRVGRRFRGVVALDDVSLSVAPGSIHALLGPNGAGKTTLLRILSGLLAPSEGSVRILGSEVAMTPRALRHRVGLVPSGDRSFYLRISALENLVFFGRLHGFRRRAADARAREVLGRVGLAAVADRRVALMSHGMQKRLSIARSLLAEPAVLLIDEATHDLDPEGGATVRALVADAARDGAAIVWATQRLDEIRAFADRVTLLADGRTRFEGTVPALQEHALPRRYVLRLRNGGRPAAELEPRLRRALGPRAEVTAVGADDPDHVVLALAEGAPLGEAVAAIVAADVEVVACRQERSDIEEAFFSLTRGEA